MTAMRLQMELIGSTTSGDPFKQFEDISQVNESTKPSDVACKASPLCLHGDVQAYGVFRGLLSAPVCSFTQLWLPNTKR